MVVLALLSNRITLILDRMLNALLAFFSIFNYRRHGLLGIRDSTERGVGKTGERKSNEIRIVYLAEVHLRLYFGNFLLLLFVVSEPEEILHLIFVVMRNDVE